MNDVYSDLVYRMYKCNDNIVKFEQSRFKVELLWMYTTVTRLSTQVGKELVDCRRLNKVTNNFEKKLEEFKQAVETLEYYITLAYLTKE